MRFFIGRITGYIDTLGKVIRYEYDAVGNLSRLIYPDNTAVTYAYDENRNLIRVTDWAGRITSYTYDVNNRVIGVIKPNGSTTTTVYDNKQRVTSTVEKTASGAVITGFEYTYDDLSRVVEEKCLDRNTKFCYTYDSLGRVTKRTTKNHCDVILSEESYTYDAAGNITGAPSSSFQYDTNNRLTKFNGNTVNYDLDGNMLSNGTKSFTYDSANRLISADGSTYTYNAEDVRIRQCRYGADTTYVYDTNCKLSKLLCKTTNGIVTKYVYGLGLIGEEKESCFKTYHFDSRGSTIAITNENCTITDTLAYDTYGKVTSHVGTSFVIFGYNGRDGVVTDANDLIYMRARYYSPKMRRFINADIVAGEISNAITLNRFAYANGNPVSFIDPFGLSPRDSDIEKFDLYKNDDLQKFFASIGFDNEQFEKDFSDVTTFDVAQNVILNEDSLKAFYITLKDIINSSSRPDGLGKRQWNKMVKAANKNVDALYGPSSKLALGLKFLSYVPVAIDVIVGAHENMCNEENWKETLSDAGVDLAVGIGTTVLTNAVSTSVAIAASKATLGVAASLAIGAATLTASGVLIGMGAGILVGIGIYLLTEAVTYKGKSPLDWIDDMLTFK